jgi:hypothetical protein
MKLIAAVVAGLIASLIGAAVWAGITFSTGYQIGLVAIGVGFLCGFAVRLAGQGSEPIFGVIGAGFALLGCVLGNFLSAVAYAAKEMQIGFWDLLTQVDLGGVGQVIVGTFQPMDLLFYAIAIYEGYKFSIVAE